jgi:hypothetical protein
MTNKTEDRFYFGKRGQPERFSGWENLPIDALKGEAERLSKYFYYSKNRGEATSAIRYDISNIQKELTKRGTPSKVLAKILQTDPLISYRKYFSFSRPGQPERFDASSLDRKGFAAASSSPMLGKLLSEKQMPEGGWRAVETGGNALVISFEDGDVAGNFARRVASNGYSATAPVQSIGRYWNVEVKNGKV